MALKRDLHTTIDLLKPAALQKTRQKKRKEKGMKKRITYRGQQVKGRVFTLGESVLARYYRGEFNSIHATGIAQTLSVLYRIHTTDDV